MSYDPEKKIEQLRKRGWSEKRIAAHMRARNFDVGTKTSRRRENERKQNQGS